MSTNDTYDSCDTCGQEFRMVSDGEGISHWEPIERSAGATPLDVERLENAIDTVAVIVDHRQGTHVTADDAQAIIEEYARASERTDR